MCTFYHLPNDLLFGSLCVLPDKIVQGMRLLIKQRKDNTCNGEVKKSKKSMAKNVYKYKTTKRYLNF